MDKSRRDGPWKPDQIHDGLGINAVNAIVAWFRGTIHSISNENDFMNIVE